MNRFSVPRSIGLQMPVRETSRTFTPLRSLALQLLRALRPGGSANDAEQWLESTLRQAAYSDGAQAHLTAQTCWWCRGPSLKQDLELLSEVQDRLIFASVKALSALFGAGIKWRLWQLGSATMCYA